MSEMLEKILSNENIRFAKKRVYANKGASGVDGVTVQELDEYMSLMNIWLRIGRVSSSKSERDDTDRSRC